MSQAGDVSRPSLHKSTPPKTGDSAALRRAALAGPATIQEGVNLRAEAWDADGNLKSMRKIVWEWREAVKNNRDTWATFEDEDGEQATAKMTDRFHPDVFDKRYAKLNDLVDGLQDEYAMTTTVMLSLTASSTFEDGHPIPPVDHLLGLDESKDAVNSALDRVLEGRRWERVVLPEQHESGYLHWHWAIIVEGRVRPGDFQPVIDAHVRNCAGAEHEGHPICPDDPNESAVSVREEGESLPGYLMSYTLGDGDEYRHDPLEAPEERQMMCALLWATNKRYWRPSDGAQRHMSLDREVSNEWELVGFRETPDGTLHEVPEDWSGGGVQMFETRPPP